MTDSPPDLKICAGSGVLGSAVVPIAQRTAPAITRGELEAGEPRACGVMVCRDCSRPVRWLDGMLCLHRPSQRELGTDSWPPPFVGSNRFSPRYRLYLCHCDFHLVVGGHETVLDLAQDAAPLASPGPSWICSGHSRAT